MDRARKLSASELRGKMDAARKMSKPKEKKKKKSVKELADDSPFKAKDYTIVKQWSFEDSKFKRVARPDIYKSHLVRTHSPPLSPSPPLLLSRSVPRRPTDIHSFPPSLSRLSGQDVLRDRRPGEGAEKGL